MSNPWIEQTDPGYYLQTVEIPQILTIADSNGKTILTIDSDGTVTWEQESKSTEAVQVFVDALQIGVEKKAGIREGRKQWEKRVMDAMVAAAEQQPLTAEVLTTTFKKCIMYGRLKGIE